MISRMKRLSLAAICIAGLSAATPAQATKADGILRFAYDQTLESVDPYFSTQRLSVILSRNVFDTLIHRDEASGEYKPLLASAWEWKDDKTLEMTMRSGVKFQDGRDFSADDVVYTLNYVRDPANKALSLQNTAWIESVEKIADDRIRIKAKHPFPVALDYLSSVIPIMPKDQYTGPGGNTGGKLPVGTGPYRYSNVVPGTLFALERNTAYFSGSPRKAAVINKVEIRIIPDKQTQMAEIMSGGLDLIINVAKDQAEQLATMPDLMVVNGETMRIVFLQINSLDNSPTPALKDVRVRRAINHAFDRSAMAKNMVGEGSNVLSTVCYPAQFGCTTEGASVYEYNPAKAKQLLAEAGFANGLSFSLTAYREREQAEAMINYLRAVGINANLQFLQPGAARDVLRAGQISMIHNAWGAFSIYDVSATLPVFFGSQPDDVSRDPKLKDILDKAGAMIDPAERKKLYQTALAHIADQAYAAPLYNLPVFYVTRKELSFKPSSDEIIRFWEMSWQ